MGGRPIGVITQDGGLQPAATGRRPIGVITESGFATRRYGRTTIEVMGVVAGTGRSVLAWPGRALDALRGVRVLLRSTRIRRCGCWGRWGSRARMCSSRGSQRAVRRRGLDSGIRRNRRAAAGCRGGLGVGWRVASCSSLACRSLNSVVRVSMSLVVLSGSISPSP